MVVWKPPLVVWKPPLVVVDSNGVLEGQKLIWMGLHPQVVVGYQMIQQVFGSMIYEWWSI
jgi:hypothetical protein